MMITIYGSPKSSAGRCFWCLEEVGATYENKSINFREGEHKSEEFLKINPNGKIPVLVHDDFTIWESMGINFYLADAFKPELLGANSQERGLVHQWSIWSIADLQAPLIAIFIQLIFIPEERRDHKVIEQAEKKLPALFETLNNSLANSKYLAGDQFSLADLNVASVVAVTKEINYDMTSYTNINNWLGVLSERPAYQKYEGLKSE
jgi:glutathione S-transferase